MKNFKKINNLIKKFNIKDYKVKIKTPLGIGVHSDTLKIVKDIPRNTVDLIITSPPFGLIAKKKYGNLRENEYIEWFLPFAKEFHRILKKNGSFVIDIGGAWTKGLPTKSLYDTRLLLRLIDDSGFHLAQEFYWWNPSRLPTPAEWVTKRRVRVKDSVNKIWWLSKTEWPKSDNLRILEEEKFGMNRLREKGYNAGLRPSGHEISKKSFFTKTKGAIPSNLIAVANTGNDRIYSDYCKEKNIEIHPARFPEDIPEFFLRFLTNENDIILDPFAGSCTSGAVAERLGRYWINIDIQKQYLKGGKIRFNKKYKETKKKKKQFFEYKIKRPGSIWEKLGNKKIKADGGKNYKKN